LAKRLSEKQKQEIIRLFLSGKTIDYLAFEFNCTKLTISRNLKKILGEKKFKNFVKQKKSKYDYDNAKINNSFENENNSNKSPSSSIVQEQSIISESELDCSSESQFIEIAPLDYEIDNAAQKDLSSVPISEFKFPNVVYMIVDKNIELEINYLKEYPDWQFLSREELNRKTIKIYIDLKNAKRFCNKDHKVIKVPNTEVFKIVAPILIAKGITRIISDDVLIAL